MHIVHRHTVYCKKVATGNLGKPVKWGIWQGKLNVSRGINEHWRMGKNLPNNNKLTSFLSIKYPAQAFNHTILHTWFSKPQLYVWIITSGARWWWCMFEVASVIIKFCANFWSVNLDGLTLENRFKSAKVFSCHCLMVQRLEFCVYNWQVWEQLRNTQARLRTQLDGI